MPRPVSDEERSQIIEAVRAGGTCRAVADEFKRSPSTVSKIAKAAGLSFDRSQTKAATKAKQEDNRARRADLAPVFLDKAEKSLEKIDVALKRMEGPTLVYNFGGRDNTYEEHVLDEPPSETLRAMATMVRDLTQAAKNAQAAVLDAERIDQPQQGQGALEGLVEAIKAARG